MDGHGYLTVAQVAEKLAVSELTVRRKIKVGAIPAIRLADRGAIRIPEHGLEHWLEGRQINPCRTGPEAA